MPMQDLYQALQMFSQGVNQLQTQRAITSANEQVQQIRASEASEADKRNALQQISSGLVSHLAGMGTPATTLAAVADSIGPRQYANANQMNADALLTGNQALAQQAASQQAFEQNPTYKIATIQAKAQMADPVARLKFQALQDDRFARHAEALDKRVDTQMARFGNIAKLQQVNNTIADARNLLHGDIYNMNVAEVAKTLDRVLSQAAPTMSGTKEVTPDTLKQMLARSKEFVTSKPQKVDIPEFVAFYNKTLDRIEGINNKIISGAQRQAIQAVGPTFAKMNPEAFKLWAAARTGEDVEVDSKTGAINFTGNKSNYGQSTQQPAPPANPSAGAMDISKYLE